jgi:hypothetical protein
VNTVSGRHFSILEHNVWPGIDPGYTRLPQSEKNIV